jgi:hypothetical protein
VIRTVYFGKISSEDVSAALHRVYGALPEKLRAMSEHGFLCFVAALAAERKKGGEEKEG